MPATSIYINLPLFLLGLLIIIKGSDLFLDSAIWMAEASGISQIVIGATIVSLCTTLPELVSSSTAAAKGAVDMALGNAVGSVICNTGLILGAMLLLITARVRREVFLTKGVFMVGAILVALFLLLPDPQSQGIMSLTRADGAVLLVLLAIYTVVNYYEARHKDPIPTQIVTIVGTAAEPVPEKPPPHQWRLRVSLFLGGGLMVAIGAWLLIEFGQGLARNLGISEAVVSLLFIALGTSLPELFTAISAVRKKAEHISIGNIFGANVLNIALVTGTAAMIRPLQIRDLLLARFDIPAALLICTVAFGSGMCRGHVGRRTGILLLTIYGAYLVTIVLQHRVG